MIDSKQIVINDLKTTLEKLEQALRLAGNVEMQCYHNARDKQLANEFLKTANEAKRSIDFAEDMAYDS